MNCGRLLRGYFIGVLLVGLAACNAPRDSALEGGLGHRDQSVPIGVTSRFEAKRFVGPWQVRAVLPHTEAFHELALVDTAAGVQLQIAADVCDAAGTCGRVAETLDTKREGKGRYVVTMPDGQQRRLWVLWVDEGFRTALIGNPEGTFAWIIDRSAKGGRDRIAAAREILDFNGYDPSGLKVVQ